MIVSVDPGNTGAIAALGDTGTLLAVHDMPVVNKNVSPALVFRLMRLLANSSTNGVERVIIERAQSMPGQGVVSTFRYGTGYGIVLGVALEWPVELVTPTEWKRGMKLAGKDKDASRQRAIEEWPGSASLFRRKKDHGRAEAALLGLWWLRHGRA